MNIFAILQKFSKFLRVFEYCGQLGWSAEKTELVTLFTLNL